MKKLCLLVALFTFRALAYPGSASAENPSRIVVSASAAPVFAGPDTSIAPLRVAKEGSVLNVIRGDMSFVGPRPERPCFVEELRKQIPYYDERHSVRPGITGWAQVQYVYGASVEDAFKKLEYDLFYLKNTSLSFDLAIILKTIKIVIGGHGGR